MGLAEYLFGVKAEDRACKFLKKQGYKVIERNFHSKFGEIDIIAKKDEILHFIEVKSTAGDYEVAERLDAKKYEKILKTIKFYELKRGIPSDFQIDLVCISDDVIEFCQNISF